MTTAKPRVRNRQPPAAPPPKSNLPPSEGGISRERIRQIEKMALRKLRHRMTLLGLRPEDLLPD